MEATNYYLNDLLSSNNKLKIPFNGIAKSEQFKEIRELLTKKLNGIPLPSQFFKIFLSQLNELLHLDLGGILANAWKKSEILQRYMDVHKFPSDETVLLPLKDHRIISDHSPLMKPFVNGISVGEIPLQIHLELDLKGVLLKIQDRHLGEISVDSCEGFCSVKYNEMTIYETSGITFAGMTIPIGVPKSSGISE